MYPKVGDSHSVTRARRKLCKSTLRGIFRDTMEQKFLSRCVEGVVVGWRA